MIYFLLRNIEKKIKNFQTIILQLCIHLEYLITINLKKYSLIVLVESIKLAQNTILKNEKKNSFTFDKENRLVLIKK